MDYSNNLNEYIDPSYFEDNLDEQDLPQFAIECAVPALNYYSFKTETNQSEINPPQLHVPPAPDSNNPQIISSDSHSNQATNETNIQDVDLLDDSFHFQLGSVQDAEKSQLLNEISDDNLHKLSKENDNFQSRFVVNTEEQRSTFIQTGKIKTQIEK